MFHFLWWPCLDFNNRRDKWNGHVKFFACCAGIVDGILFIVDINFSYTHQIVGSHCFCNHFTDVAVGSLQIYTRYSTNGFIHICTSVQSFVKITDGINAISVNTFLIPETDNIKNFLFSFRIIPVQIRLFFSKEMEIVLSTFRNIFPGTSAKYGHPAVGCASVRCRITPDIVITVRIIAGFLWF